MLHRYHILELLAPMPMIGYQMKKEVGSALKTVTRPSYGTLYPALHRLLAEGAIQIAEQPCDAHPARKAYAITGRGRGELEAWLQEPAGEDHVRREFLLMLFIAGGLPRHKLRALRPNRRAGRRLSGRVAGGATGRPSSTTAEYRRCVNEYMLEMGQAGLNWLDRLIAQIETVRQTRGAILSA